MMRFYNTSGKHASILFIIFFRIDKSLYFTSKAFTRVVNFTTVRNALASRDDKFLIAFKIRIRYNKLRKLKEAKK